MYQSLTASQTSFGKSGGSATLSCTFREYGHYQYTSGSFVYPTYRYDIVPTYSLVSAVSGFSISGSTLNVAATTVDRSCQVIASYGGVSTSPITISQSSSDLIIINIYDEFTGYGYDERHDLDFVNFKRHMTVNGVESGIYASWFNADELVLGYRTCVETEYEEECYLNVDSYAYVIAGLNYSIGLTGNDVCVWDIHLGR